jgi:hypothetical protein
MGANHTVSRESAPDFTTEATEITEQPHGRNQRDQSGHGHGHGHDHDLLWLSRRWRESSRLAKERDVSSTETDRKERRVRTRIRNPFLPASVASGLSVVKLRIAHLPVKSPENRG